MTEITKIDLTRSKIDEKAQSIIDCVNGGYANPLESFLYLKFMEEVAINSKKQLLNLAIEEAEKYPEKTIKVFGAKVEKKSAASRYDYSNIPEWAELKEQLKSIEEKAKMALKGKKMGQAVIDENTGEEMILPEMTPGKSTLAVKFI